MTNEKQAKNITILKCRILFMVFIFTILVGGCTSFKVQPSEIVFNLTGSRSEIDGDRLLLYSNGWLKVINFSSGKSQEEASLDVPQYFGNHDISGDTIAWSQLVTDRNSDVYIYDIKTKEKKQITTDKAAQMNPKLWKNYLIWQDNRNDKTNEYPGKWALYLYDFKTGEEKCITTTLAAYASYNISDNRIVWEDDRNFHGGDEIRGGENLPQNNKDIFLYDIETGKEMAIATGAMMESQPDISGKYIVWEDRNNNSYNADIVLYNLETKKKIFITKDKVNQGTPKVSGDNVVWMDERRGGSTNDVILNGVKPNSDILIYNIESKIGRILTGDGPQIQPSISSSGWITYILSRQADPKVQVIKY